MMAKSRSNHNSPKSRSKKLNFQFSPKLQKRLTQKKSKRVSNLKKFKFKDKKNSSPASKVSNRSYRMASPQLRKKTSNYKSKPFYSPNIKSNKASRISNLFNKEENRKKLFNGNTKINTFQERLDRFKIESRMMMKTVVKGDNDDTSENLSTYSRDKKMIISKHCTLAGFNFVF